LAEPAQFPVEQVEDGVGIARAHTVTKLGPEYRGHVLVGGSHGGIYAAYLAAKAGARAVILCDAGVGKDRAGIGGLDYLNRAGIAAATFDVHSARIADADDILRRGKISFVNEVARAQGCAPGQSVLDCARKMRRAPPARGEAPTYAESRFLLQDNPGGPEVWGIDSASLVRPEDTGQILVTASHGALLGGRPDNVLSVTPLAIAYNDAGVGADQAGIGRLAVLEARAIAAVTVAAASARIGDCRSAWETGVLSHLNAPALALGGRAGQSLKKFVEGILAAHRAQKRP
jgi:hypothetical protein